MFDGVFEAPISGAERLVDRVRRVTAWARQGGRKVAFVRHDGGEGDPLAPGKPGWPVWPERPDGISTANTREVPGSGAA